MMKSRSLSAIGFSIANNIAFSSSDVINPEFEGQSKAYCSFNSPS